MTRQQLIHFACIALFACGLSACSTPVTPTTPAAPNDSTTVANIQAHMTYLASDELEGRFPGTEGHAKAAQYLVDQFTQFGLAPLGTDGYLQPVPLRKGKLDQNSPFLRLLPHDQDDTIGETELAYPKEFMMGINMNQTVSQVTAEAIFVGYGIVASELGIDDYAGLDVAGKIVVRLPGKPPALQNDVGAHLASSTKRTQYAEAAGAIGVIVISSPKQEETRPYSRQLNYIHAERMDWLDTNGKASKASAQILASAYLPIPSAQRLFAYADRTLDEVYDALANDQIPTGFALNTTVAMGSESEHEDIVAPNVVAVVEGSDPSLKDEYVIYSAHYDHLGIGKSVKKDKINNGAMDNAIGTAVLLETARQFAQLPVKPKRSIIFIAVTAEEKGLLGSDYFAQNPTVPLSSLVGNVNLDMPLITYNFADVIAFGAAHSSMGELAKTATQQANIALTPDPWPELNLFTRSDHYSFVKQGIPAIFLISGITSFDEDDDAPNALMNFLKTNYHTPQDDMNQSFKWEAADNFTRVNFNIGMAVANQAERPKWYAESFFGQTFGKPYNQQ